MAYIDEPEILQAIRTEGFQKFNLVVMGPSGVGKSTLINAYFGQKVVETSDIVPGTQYVEEHCDSSGVYHIFDTKGIERDPATQEEAFQQIYSLIKKRSSLNDMNQHIHMIWYCLSATERLLETDIKKLAEFLRGLQKKIPVIFIITKPALAKSDEVLAEFQNDLRQYVEKYFAELPAKAAGVFDFKRPASVVTVQAINHLIKNKYFPQPVEAPAQGLDDLHKEVIRLLPYSSFETRLQIMDLDVNEKVATAKKWLHFGAAAASTACGATFIGADDTLILVGEEIALFTKIGTIFNYKLPANRVKSAVLAQLGVVVAHVVGKTVFHWLLAVTTAGISAAAEAAGRAAIATTTVETIGKVYIDNLEKFARGEISEEALTNNLINSMRKQKRIS